MRLSYINRGSKRTIVLFVLAIWMVLMHSESISQVPGCVTGPFEVCLSAGRVGTNAVQLSVRCIGHSRFEGGVLRLGVNVLRNQYTDSVILWSGKPASDSFDRTFNYTLPLAEGKKAHAAATFEGRVFVLNEVITIKRDLFIYSLPDTLLQADDYAWLDWVEAAYLMKKNGFEGKSENEIRVIDPKLWKRIMHLRHGYGRKSGK